MGNLLRQALHTVEKRSRIFSRAFASLFGNSALSYFTAPRYSSLEIQSLSDPGGRWGQLREGDLRSAAAAQLLEGRQIDSLGRLGQAFPGDGFQGLCPPSYLQGQPLQGFIRMKERDPHGKNQHEAGAKNDSGKPDASLLLMFGKALASVAEVGTFGAKKYTRGGWQSVSDGHVRYTAALLRHLFEGNYNNVDDDSGLFHDAQVAWNALARLELRIREEENDTSNEG